MQDLELDTLLDAMALGDEFVRTVVKRAVLSGLSDPPALLYRQAVLPDCLTHRGVIRAIYGSPSRRSRPSGKQYLGVFSTHPDAILHRSVTVVQMFVRALKEMRNSPTSTPDRSHRRASCGSSRCSIPIWTTTTSRGCRSTCAS